MVSNGFSQKSNGAMLHGKSWICAAPISKGVLGDQVQQMPGLNPAGSDAGIPYAILGFRDPTASLKMIRRLSIRFRSTVLMVGRWQLEVLHQHACHRSSFSEHRTQGGLCPAGQPRVGIAGGIFENGGAKVCHGNSGIVLLRAV